MGYYTVKVKPTIAASIQNAEAFAAGEVLFDWTGFEIPRGSGKLVSAAAIIKPKGDAAPTQNAFPFQLLFASNNDISLGTVGAAADRRPNSNITGMIEFPATSFGPTSMRSTAVASTSNSTVGGHAPLVVAPDVDEPATTGFHKIYVGCIAAGNFDFTSINAVNETSFDAGAQTVITMDGTSMDVREHFAPGDVLHAQDDAVLGTVKTADTATQITLTAANTEAIAEDDIIFDVNPITLVFGFED